MPFQLDDYDVAVLRALMKDGRKSFREISRETGITTPTVKARFQRLVNIGFIKSVSPIFDFDIVEDRVLENHTQIKNNNTKQYYLQQQLGNAKARTYAILLKVIAKSSFPSLILAKRKNLFGSDSVLSSIHRLRIIFCYRISYPKAVGRPF